ncbi:hypothetical protein BDV3_003541 [Batrachochytrium dendrobatidis]
MPAAPSLDWTVLLCPSVYIAFPCSLILQSILFFGSLRLWPSAFTTPAQISWILTTTSSVFMTVSSLPFLYDYFTHDSDLSMMPLLNDPAAVVCSMFFISYLVCDLIFGWWYYKEQIDLITGWLHHLIYPVVIIASIVLQFPGAFLIAAFMELPTIVLALGHMKRSFRSEYLFGFLFFLTRIVFHLYFAWRAYVVWYQYLYVMILALGTFPLHIHWFGRWVKRQIRILRKRKHLAEQLVQTESSMQDDGLINDDEIESNSGREYGCTTSIEINNPIENTGLERKPAGFPIWSSLRKDSIVANGSIESSRRTRVHHMRSASATVGGEIRSQLPVSLPTSSTLEASYVTDPRRSKVTEAPRSIPTMPCTATPHFTSRQPANESTETDHLLGLHPRTIPYDRASVILVPEYRDTASSRSLSAAVTRMRSRGSTVSFGDSGHDNRSSVPGYGSSFFLPVPSFHEHSGWNRHWLSFPVTEPTRDGVDPVDVFEENDELLNNGIDERMVVEDTMDDCVGDTANNG